MTNQSPDISRDMVQRVVTCSPFADNKRGIPEMRDMLLALLDAKEMADQRANANAVAAVVACEQLRAELAAAKRAIAWKNNAMLEAKIYWHQHDCRMNGTTMSNLCDAIAYTGDDTQCSA